MYQQGTIRGLPHMLVEIRQDLVSNEGNEAAWAERLARILRPILADAELQPSSIMARARPRIPVTRDSGEDWRPRIDLTQSNQHPCPFRADGTRKAMGGR